MCVSKNISKTLDQIDLKFETLDSSKVSNLTLIWSIFWTKDLLPGLRSLLEQRLTSRYASLSERTSRFAIGENRTGNCRKFEDFIKSGINGILLSNSSCNDLFRKN